MCRVGFLVLAAISNLSCLKFEYKLDPFWLQQEVNQRRISNRMFSDVIAFTGSVKLRHHATLRHVDVDSRCAIGGRLHLTSVTSAS